MGRSASHPLFSERLQRGSDALIVCLGMLLRAFKAVVVANVAFSASAHLAGLSLVACLAFRRSDLSCCKHNQSSLLMEP
jgi:hypothetical protein